MKNAPELWMEHLPHIDDATHKYKRGQVCVLGGVSMTGAACLSADGAARSGAGLVTIISPRLSTRQRLVMTDPLQTYRVFRPHIIVRENIRMEKYVQTAQQKGRVVCVLGPGLGDDDHLTTRNITKALLNAQIPLVLDADGLNAFEHEADELFVHVKGEAAFTPHEGEFRRIFPAQADLLETDRKRAVEEAAERSGAVIILKGAHTMIAQKNRETVINDNAPPYLATAGSGDVLSGMIAGLSAQGMSLFEAACAAVWMHGEAAKIHGIGLVAEDLPYLIPKVMQEVLGIGAKVR